MCYSNLEYSLSLLVTWFALYKTFKINSKRRNWRYNSNKLIQTKRKVGRFEAFSFGWARAPEPSFTWKIWSSISSYSPQHTLMLCDSRGVLIIGILFLDFARFVIMQWCPLHKSKTDNSPLPPHPSCLLY